MKISKDSIVPGALTSANIFFGFMAIIKVINGQYLDAGWLIIIASIMDGLDGKFARKFDKNSHFGLEFDSLADLISFGAAPAALAYGVYFHRLDYLGMVIVFFIVLCGALRLARFNTASNGESLYTGLPIPIAAVTIAFHPF